jgi:peptide/nickel transport system ATP-binding protein
VTAPLLSVRGLGKTFVVKHRGHHVAVPAVRDVSFDVGAGEAVALVGESGSGKSTTARLIARLETPSAGAIIFDGQDVLRREPRRPSLGFRARVQMIFQDPFASLNPFHTFAYQLSRPLLRHGKARPGADVAAAVRRLLETVGLTPAEDFARKRPHQASGGQRQRVAVARALAVDPQLILADEPTSMLDVSIRIDLLNLMRDLKTQRRIGYLFITHDLGAARYFADRILVMYAGLIVESGAADGLLDAPKHPYTQLLVAAVPSPQVPLAPAGAPAQSQSRRLSVLSGCPFADRCPFVMDRCFAELPAPRSVAAGHEVRCHLYAPS